MVLPPMPSLEAVQCEERTPLCDCGEDGQLSNLDRIVAACEMQAL
jgi:hypothetical protein